MPELLSMGMLVPLVLLLIAVGLVTWIVWTRRGPAPESSRRAEIVQPPAALLDEKVQFTAYRPQQIIENRWYPLLAFAHRSEPLPGEEEATHPVDEVRNQAQAILGDRVEHYRPVTADSAQAIPRSGELTLVPEMEGVEFNPERAAFRWEQSVHRADFQLRASPGALPRVARGQLTVFCGPFIVADIPLTIEITAASENAELTAEGGSRRYRRIFASYSHDDRAVVEQFEAFAESLGDQFVRDVRDLRAGQVWSSEIRDLIERADVFQLFWSWNALSSPYVKEEWEFALGLGRPGFVRPVYWEDPLPSTTELPPPRLRRLHFHRLKAAWLRYSAPRPSPISRMRRISSSATLAVALLLATSVLLPWFYSQRLGNAPDSSPTGGTADPAPPTVSNPPPDVPNPTPGQPSPPPVVPKQPPPPATGAAAPPSPPKAILDFEDLRFAEGQARLSDRARRTLDELAAALTQNPRARVVLEGHTAAIGDAEANLALGERRATTAREYLMSRGIAARRLQVVSYGEERPISDNQSPALRALNDRVSIRIEY
jgi:outer membrane protein OmpA-like peptidoglycan-associated protein